MCQRHHVVAKPLSSRGLRRLSLTPELAHWQRQLALTELAAQLRIVDHALGADQHSPARGLITGIAAVVLLWLLGC